MTDNEGRLDQLYVATLDADAAEEAAWHAYREAFNAWQETETLRRALYEEYRAALDALRPCEALSPQQEVAS